MFNLMDFPLSDEAWPCAKHLLCRDSKQRVERQQASRVPVCNLRWQRRIGIRYDRTDDAQHRPSQLP
jgi:hypothetical protein